MRFFAIVVGTVLLWIAGASAAQASADGGCRLEWKLAHSKRSVCSNMAILQPGNDTRTNLLLLMRDAGQLQPNKKQGDALFGWSELGAALLPDSNDQNGDDFSYPSRCQTNDSGREAFVNAVRASRKIKNREGDLLVAARRALQPDCEDGTDGFDLTGNLSGITSKEGRQFASYLTSALAFYDGNFDAATIGFSGIVKARPGSEWLQQAALYMIARSEMNRSQKDSFGRYGWFEMKSVDQGAVANAERGFQLYLKQYPDGQFAKSAKGLMRRVYWLGGNVVMLSSEYADALDNPDDLDLRLDLLVEEIDNKLLPNLVRENSTTDPMLSAMVLLYRMREPGYDYFAGSELPALTTRDLELVKNRFAGEPKLFEYLQAAHAFYVEKDPAKVIQLIPDDARQSSYKYLEFSRQALRGMALEAIGDRNARGFWQQLIAGARDYGQRRAVELALATNFERKNELAPIFANESAITDQTMRDILLLRKASPELLKVQSLDSKVSRHERDIALYTLLYKSLTRGRYASFLRDIELIPADAEEYGPYYGFQYEYDYGYSEDPPKVPVGMFKRAIEYDDFDCPQVKQIVSALNRNASNPSARICLADYLRLAGFDDYWLDKVSPEDQLGGTVSQFPGKPYSRLETYKKLISDRSTPANIRAYALYRAVWCYGPSGNNSCGGKEVPTSQRASWFRDLKRNHANSRWAKELKYYW
ncbi:MAG: hypothetical protein Pars2KO_20250 [Parasphingorhabdus sp.]